MSTYNVNVTLPIDTALISQLIDSGLTGCYYWARYEGHTGSVAGRDLVIRLSETEHDGSPVQWTLTFDQLMAGLAAFSAVSPRHFADFIKDDIDGTTGEVFLQCALFDEIVYG